MNRKAGAIIIEGHVQGLSNTRALGEAGIPVIVVDMDNCIARYSKYCKGFFRCPAFESDKLADFLLDLGQKKKLQGWLLLPSNDHAVMTISRNHQKLSKLFKLITPEPDILSNIYDKSRLLSVASEVGVPAPESFYARNTKPANIGLHFPVLTKGRFGLDFYRATGKKAFLSHDLHGLHKHLIKINKHYPVSKTLTQELIPDNGKNKTISLAAFCVNGEIKAYWMGMKLREHPIRFGTATCAKSIFNEVCYEQSAPLLKALNYTGVCEVEYLQDPRDKQYKLIEINARTWLWVELARQCGVNFAKMAYDFVNNDKVDYPSEYDTSKYWINPFSDFAFSTVSIFTGKLGIKEYLKSISNGKKVSALFQKGDRRPGYQYLFKIGSFLNNR